MEYPSSPSAPERPDESSGSEAQLRDLGHFARRLAQAILGEGPDADDVAQDAVIAAWRRGALHQSYARAWIATTVRRGVFGRLRSQAARRAREEESAREEGGGAPADEAMLRLEYQRRLLEAIGELSEQSQRVISLRFLEGLTTDEAAVRLELPRETVRTQTRRALVRLREVLGAQGGPFESSIHAHVWLFTLAGRSVWRAEVRLASTSLLSSTAVPLMLKKLVLAVILLALPAAWLFSRPLGATLPEDSPAFSQVSQPDDRVAPVQQVLHLAAPKSTAVAGASRSAIALAASEPEVRVDHLGATILIVGRDKVVGDDASMNGQLVIGSGRLSVEVIEGACELPPAMLDSFDLDQLKALAGLELTLGGRRAFIEREDRGRIRRLAPGEEVRIIARLMSPARLRVVDADTLEDLEQVSVTSDRAIGSRLLQPDPQSDFWVDSESRSYDGKSPLEIAPHRLLHQVWIQAEGYAPKRLSLDHSEAGRETVVELERAGELAVEVRPLPHRYDDLVLRIFDEEGADSAARKYRYPFSLAGIGGSAVVREDGTRVDVGPVGAGHWWIRLERGSAHASPEVIAVAEVDVVAGEEVTVQMVLPVVELQRGTIEGVARFSSRPIPAGVRLRARSVIGLSNGDPLGKELTFDKNGEAPFHWDLPIGDWELIVSPWQHVHEVQVTPGTTSGLTLDIPDPVTLTVQLVDSMSRRPLQAMRVLFAPQRELDRGSFTGAELVAVEGRPGTYGAVLCHSRGRSFPSWMDIRRSRVPSCCWLLALT